MARASAVEEVFYPETDGKPLAENVLQYQWIVRFIENLEAMLPDFVAGDLFWYPVKGHPEIVQAPDLVVALGRPKGVRPSYKQWEEEGVAPQVVGEVWSPSNSAAEKRKKLAFYEKYGAQEYYAYDPESQKLQVYLRRDDKLEEVSVVGGFISPLLGIRFHLGKEDLEVYTPDGRRFERLGDALLREETLEEKVAVAEEKVAVAEEKVAVAEQKAADAQQKIGLERQRAEQAEAELLQLKERLRALGLA